jgi:cytochrome c oxidase cbb3-type subunit III
LISSHSIRLVLCLSAGLAAGCGPADDGPTAPDADVMQQLRSESSAFAGRSVAELVSDDSAMQLAEQLFGANCAGCHGPTGEGKQGVMNLVDGVFSYGDSVDAVRSTITNGRASVMPAMGNKYGEMNLGQLVAYVESLSSSEPPSRLGEQGKLLYDASCATCHGGDGRGVVELGGPSLADGYWLHGDTMMAIRLIITRGAEGQCPAHGQVLMPVEIELLTAYVTSLNDS